MKTINTSRHQQLGFTIVEALVALAIMGFGILGLAGLQAALSRNADVAKQRTEAMRLAQEKIEQFRSYTGIATTASVASQSIASAPWNSSWDGNWNTLPSASGNDSITTNAVYTRTWNLSSAASDPAMRDVTVNVEWVDRASEPASVSLSTVVAKSDPADAGFLGFPLPQNKNLKRPKNRNLDIPIPAISIDGTGKSYIPWTGSSGGYLVFSDISGEIEKKCTATPTAANLDTVTCDTFDRYLLTGYISGTTSKVNLVTNIVVPFTNAQYIIGTPDCTVNDAYNQNSITLTAIPGYKYYACLIQPSNHDTDVSTAEVWSGRVDLAGATSTSLAGTTVCRFVANSSIPVPTGIDPTIIYNENHPETYLRVGQSLDNQNFYISSSNCVNTTLKWVLHATY